MFLSTGLLIAHHPPGTKLLLFPFKGTLMEVMNLWLPKTVTQVIRIYGGMKMSLHVAQRRALDQWVSLLIAGGGCTYLVMLLQKESYGFCKALTKTMVDDFGHYSKLPSLEALYL
jgi:hypothetical protein